METKCPPVADRTLVYMCAMSDPHAPDDDCIVPISQHTFFLKIHHIHSCIQYYTSAQMILVLLGCSGEFAPQLSTPRSNNQYICCYYDSKLKIQNNVWVFITRNITYKYLHMLQKKVRLHITPHSYLANYLQQSMILLLVHILNSWTVKNNHYIN